jgi:hypothetical protein
MSTGNEKPWLNTGLGREGGKFAKGNTIASGNPNNRRMYELRKCILDATKPEHVLAVMTRLLTLAVKDGDVMACRVWLEYTVGKPTTPIEVSGPDGEPARLDVASIVAVIDDVLGDDMERKVQIAAGIRQLRISSQESSADGSGH